MQLALMSNQGAPLGSAASSSLDASGDGPLAPPRAVLDALQQPRSVTLEDHGVGGTVLTFADSQGLQIVLPLSFAKFERAGATLTITAHAAVHPDCPHKGSPMPFTCTGGAAEAEEWQREIDQAVERGNGRHWGVSKSFIREQRDLWEGERARCKGLTVAEYFEDIGLGGVYDETWGWCAGVLTGLEAQDDKSAADLKSIAYFKSKVEKTETYEDMELTDYMNILKLQDLGGNGNGLGAKTTRSGGRLISYATFIAAESDSSGRRKVGEATVFVSHVWKMTAKDFFEVCLAELEENDYAWVDLYLHNQYQGPVSTIGDENSMYWINKFGELVGGIGKVIAIVTDWEAPVMLTRIWCLFELNAAIDTGADLRFVATAAERQDLSLNLNDKFESLDAIVASIEVRDCDAKRPHEIQDKAIFLSKLRGIEDDVNEKLRKEMQRWLADAAAGVLVRTDPQRPPLGAAQMALESADIGTSGARVTQFLEKYPRLPGVLTLVSQTSLIMMFVLVLPWLIPDGPFFPIGGDSWHMGDIPSSTLAAAVLMLFAMEMIGRAARTIEKHQLTRQLRAPPLFGQAAVRHCEKARTAGLLLGVAVGIVLGYVADWLRWSFSGWQTAVPAGLACLVLSVFVQMTLEMSVDAAASRASLSAKVGWLRLFLGETEAAVAIFRKAHTELLAAVGDMDALSSYIVAPGLARALHEFGQRDEARALVAEVDGAALRAKARSIFDVRGWNAASWDRYGCLVRANMLVAVGSPDAEVMSLLGAAAASGCGTPAGSRVYRRAGIATFIRNRLAFTEGGLREWDGFLQRRARGEGGQHVCDLWSVYTGTMDENIRASLRQREKMRQDDEQIRRNANSCGGVFIFLGAILLIVVVLKPLLCGTGDDCPSWLLDTTFTVSWHIAIPIALLMIFCVGRKRPVDQPVQEHREISTPWSTTTQVATVNAPVTISCPSCQNPFHVQRPAGSVGAMRVQCPHCQAPLQF
eukprot:COSAG04_NODE_1718_length_5812_cov_4.154210_3_plen_980_part_00